MVTRVGDDEPGNEVLAAMESWGMDPSGVQRDHVRPTGEVRVELEGGEPTFHILPDQAYDHIDADRAAELVTGEKFSLMYHGSLILREEPSRSALDSIKRMASLPVFVDVNLRNPWWRREEVVRSIDQARWIKLNETELALLANTSGVDTAAAFRAEHALDAVIVTRGERGAAAVTLGGIFEASPPSEVAVVDTVGAGDAFSSVFILGLAMGWSTETTLARALEFAAAQCTVSGATTRDRDFYDDFRSRGWC
jgi:fructokinase